MELKGASNAFQAFMQETPEYSRAWLEMVQKLDAANPLDSKTKALAYLSVLAAAGLTGGIPFHVQHAKTLGASREEISGAVLVGLPAVGHAVIQALPLALAAYDA
ncbi:MAG TPA: carboxymuconolactone decarboxylase family protein [Methylomusa anaerophila]|uniref:Carboxymuconolactone decarboxylase family protein n=2 Tax=Methylomusa anaerophila TaxID=1930071 RepID=A0A348AIV3_9FIRM|nr:carboxymuconolactone decarboxylase family protein [Methylomusa anaerophila]HML88872.1 carboxymuconolactone decarboxylase family protein [Methylomusa anaerophila]